MSLNHMSNLVTQNGNPPKITHPQGNEIMRLVGRLDEKFAAMRDKQQVMVKSGDYSPQFIQKNVDNLNVEFAQFATGAMGDILGDKGLLEKMSKSVWQELGEAQTEAAAAWNGKADTAGVTLMIAALPHKIKDFRTVLAFEDYYKRSDPATRRAIQLVGMSLAKDKWPGDSNLGHFHRLLKDDERGEMETPRLAAAELAKEEYYFIFPYVRSAYHRHKNALQFETQLMADQALAKLAPPPRQFDAVTFRWFDPDPESVFV